MDSGASRHISSIAPDFIDLTPRDELGVVSGIDFPIYGIGNVSVAAVGLFGKPTTYILHNVLCVPDLTQSSGVIYLHFLIFHLVVVAGFNYTFISTRDYLGHSSGVAVELIRHQGLTLLPITARDYVLSNVTALVSRDLI